MPSTSIEPIIRAVTDIMTHGRSPAAVLHYLADDCTWSLQPGGTTYRGLEEISAFISVAVSMARQRNPKEAGVTVTRSLADEAGFCLEYVHEFSFSVPEFVSPGKSRPLVMQHCNIYEVRDGKITNIREYASSSTWWLNLLAHFALSRIHAKTRNQLKARPLT